MIFGVDIDGTITAAPEQYAAIMSALRAAGHEVHVLTGQTTPVDDASRERRLAQLAGYGVRPGEHFDVLFLAGPPDWVADKGNYCAQHGVAFVFEDSHEYAAAIRPHCPVVLMVP